MVGLGRRDDHLAAAAHELHEALAAGRVELGHHVVEEHQGCPADGGECSTLGEQEREEGYALLPLGAVRAQGAAVARQGDVVAVGTVAGEAAREIVVAALGELGSELVWVGGAGPRSVLERGRARQSKLSR